MGFVSQINLRTPIPSRRVLALFLMVAFSGVVASQEPPYGQGSAVHDYIKLYQKYLSGLKGTQCKMYPTCSQYGMMVFAKHPFPKAMVMTADRLLRCDGHLDFYPEITVGKHIGYKLDYPPNYPIPQYLTTEPPHAVAVETIIPTDSTSQSIQFTNKLINQHSYVCALLEIERMLYYDSALRFEPALYVNKLRCHEGLQQYSDGVMCYEQLVAQGMKMDYKLTYTAGHLYDLLGDHDKALNLFRSSVSLWDSISPHPYGELAILYTDKDQFDEARRALEQKFSIDSNICSYVTSNTIISRLESSIPKDPTTAKLLSIIPGAGYLYTEQPRNAFVSLLVNSVLSYAVYTSIKTENYGLGIIFGAFTIAFYGGNIVGAGNSAQRYNEKLKRDATNKLRTSNPFYY